MTCRLVTNSRLTTFGRRVIITSAVFGLTTIGGAGVALADPGQVGISPAAPVVKVAPTAVSVTFGEPLRSSGARMRVLSEHDGDVGSGAVSTSAKTLRRALRAGAPGGRYTVEWKAVSAKGKKMTGSFSFTAAGGNGEPQTSPAPTSAVPTSPVPSPRVPVEATATATPGWIGGSDPIFSSPAATASAPAVAAGGSGGTPDGSVSTGFTAVPLAVGGLLVLAAGLVPVINRRPRLRS